MENTLARRLFVVPSFEIHGGVAGLYDYGPAGCSLKDNVLNYWKNHFVLEDQILQIECTTLTSYPVLKTSGHVDKFEDLMVKDTKTGECFRADKLLEDFIDNLVRTEKTLTNDRREELRKIAAQADAYEPDELFKIFQELGIKSPTTGNDLTSPFPFNLMFQTSIGPTGNVPGFLRPETAQGMFVNFRRLYDYNNGRMPMAVAQIGSAYRNEIAPRGGLIRVREFTMAEIEHFVHPDQKNHPKFGSVANLRLNLFPNTAQIGDGKTITPTMGEAVKGGIINNETLAYFMARTALFMYRIGIKPEGLRFRQHLKTEMAHYACDCWDAEILMAQGWVECVGHADRSAYDLQVHSKATKVDLSAREAYPEPREEEVFVVKANKGIMGKQFKTENAGILAALDEIAADKTQAEAFIAAMEKDGQGTVNANGKSYTLTKDLVSLVKEKRKVTEYRFVPNVIEPSFGIGRILTGLFEHSFYIRDGDEQRAVLAFKPLIAPVKVVLLPLDGRIDRAVLGPIGQQLTQLNLAYIIDDSSASIGKRYSRSDEIGVPFGITYDHESSKDNTVTLRERDTCSQIRLPMTDVPKVIRSLCDETTTWEHYASIYPVITTGETAKVPSNVSATAPVPGGGQSSNAGSNSSKTSSAGTVGVVVEGKDRNYGRFSRPADLK